MSDNHTVSQVKVTNADIEIGVSIVKYGNCSYCWRNGEKPQLEVRMKVGKCEERYNIR